jgi:hypothetical protein
MSEFKVTKSEDLEALEAVLLKARRRLSDEAEDPDDKEEDLENAGYREFDPDEGDDADKWLQENDTQKEDEENEDEPEYDEYGPDEDEESHQREPELDEEPDSGPAPEVETPGTEGSTGSGAEGGPDQEQTQEEEPTQEKVKGEGRFPQPTREEIGEMRQYTKPWEQRNRNKMALEAEAHKNPVLYRQGKLVESSSNAYKDRQQAYNDFKASPEYKKANMIDKIKLDTKFKKDWNEKNPDYARQAMSLHSAAHEEGKKAKEKHLAAQDEAARHLMSGGSQGGTGMSTEEAMQHAGGHKGEEGTVGSVIQDPNAAFAASNQEALKDWAKTRQSKSKKVQDLGDMDEYDSGAKADVQRILGEHPALKDPAKKAKVDAFFEKYHPLIGMSAQKTLNKLGLDSKHGQVDLGMLHEAGMHGLMQSINDYDHDHPSKAAFVTHASNKIRGLQQTAMRNQDAIPQEARAHVKQYNLKQMVGKHPPDVADRMKRIDTFKAIKTPKVPTGENNGQ